MMDVASLLLSMVVIFVGYILVQKFYNRRRGSQYPPGPHGMKTAFELFRAIQCDKLHLQAAKWAREYGDVFMISILGQNVLFLNNAELIRQNFKGENKSLANNRPLTFTGKYIFREYSDISFRQYDETTKRLRKIFHNSLKTYGDGVEMFEELVLTELKEVANSLQRNSTGNDVKIGEILSTSLMTVLHILLTNERPPPGSSNIEIMKYYDLWANRISAFDVDSVLVKFPFLRFLPGKYGHMWSKTLRAMNILTELFFHKRKNTYRPDRLEGMVDYFFKEQTRVDSDGQQGLTDDNIIAMTLEVIGAGYLTSRGLLLGLFLIFLHEPEVQHRIFAEITEQIADRLPSLHDRPSMPYTHAVILEATRFLSHVTLGLPHTAKEELCTADFYVPKNTTIVANMWFIHHDERVWEDPWTFRPERFLDEQGQLLPVDHPQRMKLLPFGIGLRQCPGERFAKNRIFLYITKLLKDFEFLPPKDRHMVSYDPRLWSPGIVLQPLTFSCRVLPRKASPERVPS